MRADGWLSLVTSSSADNAVLEDVCPMTRGVYREAEAWDLGIPIDGAARTRGRGVSERVCQAHAIGRHRSRYHRGINSLPSAAFNCLLGIPKRRKK
jgi:hypothetical protein